MPLPRTSAATVGADDEAIHARTNNRERILDTALTLMSERGSAGTSMRRLADACGLNVAAIYHYFPSKEALLATVIAERRWGDRLNEVAPLDPARSVADRLRVVFAELWDGALAEQQVWRLLLGEGLRGEPSAIPVGAGVLGTFNEGLSAWLADGLPELADPSAVAHLLIGQLFGAFMRLIFEPETPLDVIRDDAVAAIVAVV